MHEINPKLITEQMQAIKYNRIFIIFKSLLFILSLNIYQIKNFKVKIINKN